MTDTDNGPQTVENLRSQFQAPKDPSRSGGHRMRSKRVSYLVLATACPGLACALSSRTPLPDQLRFTSQQDAGAVQISVQSVAPFEEYVDALQPRFSLTSEAALETAIADTQLAELRTLRSALLALGVSLPTLTVSDVATTTTPPDGDTTTARTLTKTRGPSGSPVAPPAETPAGVLTPMDISSRPIAIDPSLRYRAAAALTQEVALLSTYVRDAAVSTNTAPYVVRFLITVFPSARRIPYDVYSAVSLFADWNGEPGVYGRGTATEIRADYERDLYDYDKALRQLPCVGTPVDVVPLFVTDNVESSVLTSAREDIASTGVAAGGTIANFGLTAKGRTDKRNGSRTVGRDLNSLFTLGRASGNTLETRLGAFSVEGTFHTVPRTYNLTALALLPGVREPKWNELILPCTAVRFTARSEFRDADSGQLLPRPSPSQLKELIRARFASEGLAFSTAAQFEQLLPERVKGTPFTDDPWYEAILGGNFEVYLASFNVASRPAAERLWPDLVSESRRWGWSSGRFEVPLGQFLFFAKPAAQSIDSARVPLLDDGEKAEITLAGARGLRSEGLSGSVRFVEPKTHAEVILVATSALVSKDGTAATITFPSPRKTLNGVAIDTVNAKVTYTGPGYRWSPQGVAWSWSQEPTPVLQTQRAKKDAEAGFNVSTSAPFIVADENGAGELRVQVRRSGKVDGKPLSARIALQIEGAHIVSATPALASEGADIVAELDRSYLLGMRGLMPGSTVRVKGSRKAGDTVVAGPDVQVLVIRRDPTSNRPSKE